MSSGMQINVALLELNKLSPSLQRVIISNADTDFINALCEIALNVLRGNIPLTVQSAKKEKKNNNQTGC